MRYYDNKNFLTDFDRILDFQAEGSYKEKVISFLQDPVLVGGERKQTYADARRYAVETVGLRGRISRRRKSGKMKCGDIFSPYVKNLKIVSREQFEQAQKRMMYVIFFKIA